MSASVAAIVALPSKPVPEGEVTTDRKRVLVRSAAIDHEYWTSKNSDAPCRLGLGPTAGWLFQVAKPPGWRT